MGQPSPHPFVYGQFRAHILLPHRFVGSIIDSEPTFKRLRFHDEGKTRIFTDEQGRGVLRFTRSLPFTTVEALTEVWLQEPGLVVKIAGGGTWQGYGRHHQYTSPAYGLRQKNAYLSTVHFSRARMNPKFTVGVIYRNDDFVRRYTSDGGFERLLWRKREPVPWEGCEVYGRGHELTGVYEREETLRRWELAGKMPDIGQMYFLGWTGGPGAVVDANGRTPPPGWAGPVTDYDRLYQPRSWKRLLPGETMAQTLHTYGFNW